MYSLRLRCMFCIGHTTVLKWALTGHEDAMKKQTGPWGNASHPRAKGAADRKLCTNRKSRQATGCPQQGVTNRPQPTLSAAAWSGYPRHHWDVTVCITTCASSWCQNSVELDAHTWYMYFQVRLDMDTAVSDKTRKAKSTHSEIPCF